MINPLGQVDHVLNQQHPMPIESMNFEIGEEKLVNRIYLSNFVFLIINIISLSSVRNRLRREHSGTAISPQRPCTAASNFSKNPHDASAAMINDLQKEQKTDIVRIEHRGIFRWILMRVFF